ncbi:MAG: branched-chain amino acid ABC transporter permease [Candidatus Sungiibacteriota bacterium]|uniref:Branched-chain amino acid ABC transporter permease n=1 Tax=Candidatus Sungiibacteriota bacterium TaxID=2750080 RepID=A0A7T5UR44_9BACT|nr:MAG: branched-chain amino acid ABC transporter permease [Candidatus Sungbacteria bacterium]
MNILPQLILNSVIAGAIYTLVALGFNLSFGAARFFNLAHGTVAVAGGYVVLFLMKWLQVDPVLSVISGVVSAGFIGYGLFQLVYAPLREHKASNLVLLVASLGAFIALQAILAMLFSSQFQTLYQGSLVPTTYAILGGVITQVQLLTLGSAFLITLGLALVLNMTVFGKAVRAVSDDEEVAKIVGINTRKIIGRVFFMASAIAGLGGILIGFDTGLEPTTGLPLLLKGVIASIIGGIGNVYGGVLGAFLLGFVENFGIWKISGEWKDAIAFTLLIIFLIFRPNGIIRR